MFFTLRSPDIPSEAVSLLIHQILLDATCTIGLDAFCHGCGSLGFPRICHRAGVRYV